MAQSVRCLTPYRKVREFDSLWKRCTFKGCDPTDQYLIKVSHDSVGVDLATLQQSKHTISAPEQVTLVQLPQSQTRKSLSPRTS
jgi:hypothetical protein